ncbi:MAG: 2OG-Fe(II) oxygenase [Gammaproteobacteria bacterium]|nr:2OG-Fe(II) oxygenase [Gammaproteobacteria bacterium]
MGTIDIEYAVNQGRLQALLESVNRPGSFCVHGRAHLPMPAVEVEGAGMLSLPVPAAQIRELVKLAERAPYGKGGETLVDASVRDCRQIGAEKIHLGGGAWPDTLSSILDKVSAGLGCPGGRLDARLYKLLIYETGGFFAEHRDTEKSDGMVATLAITLPTAGAGGELIVRHREEEVRIDMNASEPSELAFAAFYADCAHETLPLREGSRLSLVFNLVLRPGDAETPREAPDYSRQVREITEEIIVWRDAGRGPDKLVWVLEHDYSDAGLSFDALKNADDAVAGVLKAAAEAAECQLYATILHIEEEGTVLYTNDGYFNDWGWSGGDVNDLEMDELLDGRYWLDGWVEADGGRTPLGQMSLRDGEILPAGVLDEAMPDQQRINEATGNEDVTLERAYRLAAFVIWPRRDTISLLAAEDVGGAVAWVERQIERDEAAGRGLMAGLIDVWPAASEFLNGQDRDDRGRKGMLRLLARLGDAALTLRFLKEVLLERYNGSENPVLPEALATAGPAKAKGFLDDLIESRFSLWPDAILKLLLRTGELPGFDWRGTLRGSGLAALAALPDALKASKDRQETPEVVCRTPAPSKKVSANGLRDLFTLTSRCGLPNEAEAAAAAIVSHPGAIKPERAVPKTLKALSRKREIRDGAAYLTLWRHAADSLLARSATPPEEPQDWVISADVSCACEHCARLKAFCKDPDARVGRFPLRKALRKHLHRQIDGHRLDMSHVTERRGRPFTLVCTKNRASHERRLKEYAKDIEWMRSLAEQAPGGEKTKASAQLRRLQDALAAADG